MAKEKEENLQPRKKKKKKRKTAGDMVRMFIMLISLAIFLFSAYQLLLIYLEYKAGTDEYNGLRNLVAENGESVVLGMHEDDGIGNDDYDLQEISLDFNRLDVDFTSLQSINKDIIGWIQVEAIETISYPVVKSHDNDDYLHLTFEGNYNGAGSIFVDCDNESDFSDQNTFIYGHNMKNGSMFGSLKNFHKQETYDISPYIWVYTPLADYRYEIFSYHVASIEDDIFEKFYNSDEEYKEYLDKAKRTSEYETGVDVSVGDRIITLSTCTGNDTTRFLVHAKLVTIIPN